MTILLFALMAIPNTLAGVAKWQLIWAIVGVVFSAMTIEDRNFPGQGMIWITVTLGVAAVIGGSVMAWVVWFLIRYRRIL